MLLLAIIWESDYLKGLKDEDRSKSPIWTKPRIRAWALLMSAAAVAAETTALLVLAKILDDGAIPKAIILGGAGALLATMCTRLAADIVNATQDPPAK